MNKYETFSHTADIRMKITGKTAEELFLVGLLGMGEILKKNLCKTAEELPVKTEISISSVDQTSLLINFLNEALTMSYENTAIFCKINFRAIGEKYVDATLEGIPIEEFDGDIKAVTYHEAEIRRNKEGSLETMIIFDI